MKTNDWQEIISFDQQASVNAISWAPWECGLKLLACSADGTISLFSRRSMDNYWVSVELKLIADDQWDTPITFAAHDSSVNSIAWANLHSGNDYFVTNTVSIVF